MGGEGGGECDGGAAGFGGGFDGVFEEVGEDLREAEVVVGGGVGGEGVFDEECDVALFGEAGDGAECVGDEFGEGYLFGAGGEDVVGFAADVHELAEDFGHTLEAELSVGEVAVDAGVITGPGFALGEGNETQDGVEGVIEFVGDLGGELGDGGGGIAWGGGSGGIGRGGRGGVGGKGHEGILRQCGHGS